MNNVLKAIIGVCSSLKQVQLPLGGCLCAGAPLHYTYAHSESSQRIINEGECNGKKSLRKETSTLCLCSHLF